MQVAITSPRHARDPERADLRARIERGWNVTHTVQLYAFAEPGYSTTNADDRPMPPGAGAFELEAGEGARLAAKPGLAITA
ncbi:MAG TPA: hypothetical protein VH143_17160 [Kofleriaceae bacterium]|nr:hypothetical protein [Kofleriaceae bacterium]